MIEIVGPREGKEFEAALHFRNQVLARWPIARSVSDQMKIFVSLKLYGYRIEKSGQLSREPARLRSAIAGFARK